jgi:chemotaxis protein CheD
MNQINQSTLKKHAVYPGELYAANDDVLISTLLGSCVAACLFDPVNRILGMNHFLLSNNLYKQNGNGFTTPSGRYGVHAMELLINRMYKLGAQRKHLRAKAFGGATLRGFNNGQSQLQSIGEINMRFVREFLSKENIPLVAEDLGGTNGRNIYFDSKDYSVYVKKHHPVNLKELIETENLYRAGIEKKQKENHQNINLWN